MTLNVLIVEDEKIAMENLSRILLSHFPEIRILGNTASIRDTVNWLQEHPDSADVIFMDIELSDGNCFEIFRQTKVNAKVIMTTAYDRYAVKAFEAGSIDYLLKPVDQQVQTVSFRHRHRKTVADIREEDGVAAALHNTYKRQDTARQGR